MNVNNQKGFANIILIFVIIAAVAVGGYFVLVKKSEPIAQQPTPSLSPTLTPSKTTTPSPTPSSVIKSGWETYTNSNYNFSIQYPCDTKCQSSPPAPYKNAYVVDEIYLPTITTANVLLFTFTDESVKEWNDTLEGPGTPFPFSLSSAREALKLPVNSSCKISSYFDSKSTSDCTIVLVGGEKAVRLINGIPRADYPNRNYILNRGGNKWLEIIEVYSTSDYQTDFLSDESKATPEIRNQINAISEVIKTIKF